MSNRLRINYWGYTKTHECRRVTKRVKKDQKYQWQRDTKRPSDNPWQRVTTKRLKKRKE